MNRLKHCNDDFRFHIEELDMKLKTQSKNLESHITEVLNKRNQRIMMTLTTSRRTGIP